MSKWQRKIEGYERMTAIMFDALRRLSEAHDRGNIYYPLDGVHIRTIRAMIARDWIIAGEGGRYEGCYHMTRRGALAFRMYRTPLESRRYDGICPICGVRPKAYTRNGNCYGYCRECDREKRRRQRELFGQQKNPNRICPRCGERKVHVTASGNVRSLCQPCRRKDQKVARKRQTRRKLERIAQGEVLLCIRCKAAPRYHTVNTVSDYCHSCLRAYMNDYNYRRRRGAVLQKHGLSNHLGDDGAQGRGGCGLKVRLHSTPPGAAASLELE